MCIDDFVHHFDALSPIHILHCFLSTFWSVMMSCPFHIFCYVCSHIYIFVCLFLSPKFHLLFVCSLISSVLFSPLYISFYVGLYFIFKFHLFVFVCLFFFFWSVVFLLFSFFFYFVCLYFSSPFMLNPPPSLYNCPSFFSNFHFFLTSLWLTNISQWKVFGGTRLSACHHPPCTTPPHLLHHSSGLMKRLSFHTSNTQRISETIMGKIFFPCFKLSSQHPKTITEKDS